MIISRTPFRISFFGGGTDYPDWYHKYGGATLSTTINKYTYITCRWLPPFFNHKYRIAYSKVEDVKIPGEIVHPTIRAVLSDYACEKGIELHSDADLPARAGLGSSSTFTVGLLNAVEALHGRRAAPLWLAKRAIHYEQDVLKESVGSQDQTAAAFGGLNVLNFERDGRIDVQPVVINKMRKQLLDDHLMLFFTGFSRSASEIAQTQIANMETRSKELHAMYGMVDDAVEILSSDRDIRDFGALLHQTWMYKRGLSQRVTNESIDRLYETARHAGAIGGKLLGAGGGGFFLLFVEPSKQEHVKHALSDLLHVPFSFGSDGTRIIYYDE